MVTLQKGNWQKGPLLPFWGPATLTLEMTRWCVREWRSSEPLQNTKENVPSPWASIQTFYWTFLSSRKDFSYRGKSQRIYIFDENYYTWHILVAPALAGILVHIGHWCINWYIPTNNDQEVEQCNLALLLVTWIITIAILQSACSAVKTPPAVNLGQNMVLWYLKPGFNIANTGNRYQPTGFYQLW